MELLFERCGLRTPRSEIAMMLDQSAIESLKKLRSELFEMSKHRDLTDKRDVLVK